MKSFHFLYLCLAFLLGSCTSAQVSTSQDPRADLSSYQSYAFLPQQSDLSVKDRNYDKSAVLKAMEEINDEMKALGYKIDLNEPELLVKVHIASHQKEDVQTKPVYSSYPYFEPGFEVGVDYPYYYEGYADIGEIEGYDIKTVEYQKTAVVVDLIDANTHEIVWRGWAKDKGNVEDIKNDLKVYIDEIFDEYPVGMQS